MNTHHSGITQLILDFGGVIYQISHQRQKEAFRNLGISNFDVLYSQAQQSPLFAEFERGHISNKAFWIELVKLIGNDISMERIENAWNSILVGFPDENIQFLNRLQKNYDLFLLSNTNAIHYDVYTMEFKKKYGYDFNEIFKKTFWSFKMGMRKPDTEIYRFVKSEIPGNIDSALFIDDTQVNISASLNEGLPARWLQPGQKLADLFDENCRLKV